MASFSSPAQRALRSLTLSEPDTPATPSFFPNTPGSPAFNCAPAGHAEFILLLRGGAKVSSAAVSAALGALPDAPALLRHADKAGRLPLLYALESGVAAEPLLALLEALPAAAAIPDSGGRTALHWSFARGADASVAKAVLAAHPGAAALATRESAKLPLHYALEYRAPPELVFALLEAHPVAAAAGDKQDLLPLHLAVAQGAEMPVVRALLAAHPAAAAVRGKEGKSPLDIALAQRPAVRLDVCEALLLACPAAAALVNGKGRTPLHEAIVAPAIAVGGADHLCVEVAGPSHSLLPTVGDAVRGHFKERGWYTARVIKANGDGTFNLRYFDGDVERDLPLKRLRTLEGKGFVDPAVAATPQQRNDEGCAMRLGSGSGASALYCGRVLGKAVIPGSDGQCGPDDGPQCASCKRGAATPVASAAGTATGAAHSLGAGAAAAPASAPGAALTSTASGVVGEEVAPPAIAPGAAPLPAGASAVAHARGGASASDAAAPPIFPALGAESATIPVPAPGAAAGPDLNGAAAFAPCADTAAPSSAPPAVSRDGHTVLVELLLRAHPGAAAVADKDERTPLREAVKHSRSAALIKLLLGERPQAATEKGGSSGGLPLHVAVGHGIYTSLEVLQLLIDAHPAALRAPATDGELPLHFALLHSQPAPQTLFVLQAYPEAAAVQVGNELPVFLAVRSKADVEVVEALLAAYPAAGAAKTSGGKSLLEAALAPAFTETFGDGKADVGVVRALLRACPALATAASDFLASGLAEGIPAEVVEALLDAYPAAAEAKRDGRSLLELALLRAPSSAKEAARVTATVRALLRARPALAASPGVLNRSMISLAVSASLPEAALLAILEAAPEAAGLVGGTSKCTALHKALLGPSTPPSFNLALLRAFPGAVRIADATGDLPLHNLFLRPWKAGVGVAAASLEDQSQVVEAVLREHPDAASILSGSKKVLPLLLALRANAPFRVVEALLAAHPAAAEAKMESGRGALELALTASPADVGAVHALLRFRPQLATALDAEGKPVLFKAITAGAGEEVLLAVLEAAPEAATLLESVSQTTVLHKAVTHPFAPNFVAALLRAHPNAAKLPDAAGNLPLHCLFQGGSGEGVCLSKRHAHNMFCLGCGEPRCGLTYGPPHGLFDEVAAAQKAPPAAPPTSQLPDGWTQRVSTSTGRNYFAHLPTGRTTWERPRGEWGGGASTDPGEAAEKLQVAEAHVKAFIVEALLHEFPGACGVLNSKQQYPLALAVRAKAPSPTLHTLLSAHPRAAEATGVGACLLHFALCNGADEAFLLRLIEADQGAVAAVSNDDASRHHHPLHLRKSSGACKVCNERRGRYFGCASCSYDECIDCYVPALDNALIAHLQGATPPSLAVVRAMLASAPGLAAAPFEMCAAPPPPTAAPVSVKAISKGCKVRPSASADPEKCLGSPMDGRTGIVDLIDSDGDYTVTCPAAEDWDYYEAHELELVEGVAHAATAPAMQLLLRHRHPLIKGAASGPRKCNACGPRVSPLDAKDCFSCNECLYDLCGACYAPPPPPSYPLHAALLRGGAPASDEVVLALLAAHPAAVAAADADGRTLLHKVTTDRGGSWARSRHLFAAFLSAYPAAARVADREGKLPLAYALEAIPLDVTAVKSLLLCDPPALSGSSGDSGVEGGSWHLLFFKNASPDSALCAVADECLSQLFPSLRALRAASTQKSWRGRSLLDIAEPSFRALLTKRLFVFQRYELLGDRAVHESDTSIVWLAADHGGAAPSCSARDGGAAPVAAPAQQRKVALKFMRERAHWLREQSARHSLGGDARVALLPLLEARDCSLRGASGATGDARGGGPSENVELARFGLQNHPFLLVLPQADTSLASMVLHERLAENLHEVRAILSQLARALAGLHAANLVHGDLKPLNVMRCAPEALQGVGGADASSGAGAAAGAGAALYALIDMDASAPMGVAPGAKLSSAYASPELAAALLASAQPSDGVEGQPPTLPLAHPARDMWALGALLYQLVTGTTLVHGDRNDAANDVGALAEVAEWSEGAKTARLAPVRHRFAAHLLSQLLSRSPEARPSAEDVLRHPFLTGEAVLRLPGEHFLYDVFLSYRVAADYATVEALYARLCALGLRVWWDKRSILPGENWRASFCRGLARAKLFVTLVSRAALAGWPALDPARAACDNLLLEHRMALELEALGILPHEAVLPLFVGRGAGGGGDGSRGLPAAYESYFQTAPPLAGSALPEAPVLSVEAALAEEMEGLGLGSPTLPAARRTLAATAAALAARQAVAVLTGPAGAALDDAAAAIRDTAARVQGTVVGAPAETGGGLRVQLQDAEDRARAAEQRAATAEERLAVLLAAMKT